MYYKFQSLVLVVVLRFTMQFDPSLPPVRGDKNQLIQVFLNLTKNAVEATQGPAEVVMNNSLQKW